MKKTPKNYTFKSKLAIHINGLINEKRSCGYIYNNEAAFLYQFDRFLIENDLDYGLLDQKVISAWSVQRSTECANSRKYRVEAVGVLAKYMQSLGLEACNPQSYRLEPRPIRYIPDSKELHGFFKYVDTLTIYRGERQLKRILRTIVIYRLYYLTGMRLSEAIFLKWEELDFETGKLEINFAKGDHPRIIYLNDAMVNLLKRYQKRLHDAHIYSIWIFPGENLKNNINLHIVESDFLKLWKAYKGDSFDPNNYPTVHSLRHAFTMARLNEWQLNGINVHTMMPYLSAHLGHKSPEDTYYYIHGLQHLLPAARSIIDASQLNSEVYCNDFED